MSFGIYVVQNLLLFTVENEYAGRENKSTKEKQRKEVGN